MNIIGRNNMFIHYLEKELKANQYQLHFLQKLNYFIKHSTQENVFVIL